MIRTLGVAYVLLVAAGTQIALGDTSGVDWKYYGGAPTSDGQTLCFYDTNGVVREPSNRLRVWVKCLLQKEIEVIDIEKAFGGKIFYDTARKVARYYIPPIGRIETLNADQAMTVTEYEEVADTSDIQPNAQILYEINCADKMERELSVSLFIKGKRGDTDEASAWKYVPPEGNGAHLVTLLCPEH